MVESKEIWNLVTMLQKSTYSVSSMTTVLLTFFATVFGTWIISPIATIAPTTSAFW